VLVRLLGLVDVVVQPLLWFFLALFLVVLVAKNLIKVLAVFWGTAPTTFCGLEGNAMIT
jgi:hypothetical protein